MISLLSNINYKIIINLYIIIHLNTQQKNHSINILK